MSDLDVCSDASADEEAKDYERLEMNRFLGVIKSYRQSATTEERVNNYTQTRWRVLLFGQAIALSAASVNASSFTLQNDLGVMLPTFQLFITYLFLSSHLWCRRDNKDGKIIECADQPGGGYTLPLLGIPLRVPWWIYLFVSIIDVEANYLTLVSFRFTSLTSTTLLGSLTVPSVMVFSRCLLDRSFRSPHYIGVCLCLIGGTMMVWSDHIDWSSTTSSSQKDVTRVKSCVGDVLAMSSAFLYGFGDTVAEYAVKRMDRAEYLGMIGLFGCILSGVQFLLLEWPALVDLLDTTRHKQIFWTILWYIASLLFYYISASIFLIKSDATLLNLSLQTGSLWACLFSVIAQGVVPPLLFYLAVVLVSSGVCVYELGATQNSCHGRRQSSEEAEMLKNNHDRDYMTMEMEAV